MAARLKERYHKEIKQALQKELGLDNPMAVPELDKIVVNMGLGEATGNTKLLDPLVADLATITGQKPVTTKAKKSIAAFKVRAGMSIGAMVTLRNEKAYEFLDRLISTALPRVRDFRGVSTKSFDGRGNYTLGSARPVDLPGDRLLQGGKDEGHEHHHCDHGEGRQPGAGAAEALRDAVPARGVRAVQSSQFIGWRTNRETEN
jgi:large subunit ribosomal protein L5